MKYAKYILILALLAASGACTKDFEDYNTNPNKQSEGSVAPIALLEPLIYSSTNSYSSYMLSIANEISQVTVAKSTPRREHCYNLADGNFKAIWNLGYKWAGNAKHMYDLAVAQNQPNFQAIGLTLKVYNMSILTDMFGSIAYREALKYAHERRQFGKPIVQFAAVSEMLSNMKAKLQGARALLYETTRFVEMYKQYGHIAQERSLAGEERQEMKFYNRLADGFTPLVKLFASEYANQLAYDAIQIHGGSGFMKDYPCERLYRDARIMNIYEGTSQLQVVAAINAVTKGTFMEQIERYAAGEYVEGMQPVVAKLRELTAKFAEMIAHVEAGEKEVGGFKDFHARRLVETAGHIIITYLLARQAGENEEYVASARIFAKLAEGKIAEAHDYVMNSTLEDVELFRKVIRTEEC